MTNKIEPSIILTSPYLTKEIPLLNRYRENLFNPDNSVNAYKLYDFLTYELDTIEKEIRELVSK